MNSVYACICMCEQAHGYVCMCVCLNAVNEEKYVCYVCLKCSRTVKLNCTVNNKEDGFINK